MASIRSYIKISEKAKSITELFETPDNFLSNYFELEPLEQKSYINHIIVNNRPYIYKEIPILYEQIVQFLADELELDFSDVKLIGSAKTGFSISPNPDYGKPFTEKSDIDFTIVNKELFQNLVLEFNLWKELYEKQEIEPNNDTERYFWNDNLINVSKNITRGFLDTYKVPNRDPFPLACKINNLMYLIPLKVNEIHKIKNYKASLRVYINEVTFLKQLKLNTESVLRNLK